ncbi:MAG: hypothetical protein HC911_16635 [Chloroflexaceae bacterium]|nr:hypothetical protein [Chloroflexaceae bacterium]
MEPDDLYPRFEPTQPNQCENQVSFLEEREERYRKLNWDSDITSQYLAAWDALPDGRMVMLASFGITFGLCSLQPELLFWGHMDERDYQRTRYLQATTSLEMEQVRQEFLDLHRNYIVWMDPGDMMSEWFMRLYGAMLWKEEKLRRNPQFVHPPVPASIEEQVYKDYRKQQERSCVHDPATIAVELDPVTEHTQTLFDFWGTLPVRYRVRYQTVAPWVAQWCHLREVLLTTTDAGAARAVAEQCIAQLHAYREQVAQWQLVSTQEVGWFQTLGGMAQWRAAQLGYPSPVLLPPAPPAPDLARNA